MANRSDVSYGRPLGPPSAAAAASCSTAAVVSNLKSKLVQKTH